MKNTFLLLVTIMSTLTLAARPALHGFHRAPPSYRPYHPPRHHHPHYVSYPTWSAFAGGVVGGAIVSAITRPTTVVVPQTTVIQSTAPVVETVVASPTVQKVWIQGYYKDILDERGAVIRREWVPGHWEYVQ